MLDPAQVTVRGRQRIGVTARDVPGAGEPVQRGLGARRAQARLAAAPDELLRLDVELDLADAAAARLDVVPGDLNRAPAAVGVDLALDRMDVLDCPEIQVLAPDEGAQGLQERRAHIGVAGARARLDHGRAFPVLPLALVVHLGRAEGDGHGHGRGIGAQAQVHARNEAVARTILENAHQILRNANTEVFDILAAVVGNHVWIVNHDQIDVGGIVEFARAQFAHAQNGEAAARLRRIRVGQDQVAARMRLAQQEAQRGIDRRVGKRGQGLGDLVQVPQAGHVRQRRPQRHPPARPAQRRHGGIPVGLGHDLRRHVPDTGPERRVGPLCYQIAQPVRIREDAARKEGTVREHGAHQMIARRRGEERAQGLGRRGVGRGERGIQLGHGAGCALHVAARRGQLRHAGAVGKEVEPLCHPCPIRCCGSVRRVGAQVKRGHPASP